MITISELRNVFRDTPSGAPLIGRDRYTSAAITIPIVTIEKEVHLLFEQRAAAVPQGGEICFPGGEFDSILDTTLQDTALRETQEELGIRRTDIELLGMLGTVLMLRGHAVDCFGALLAVPDSAMTAIDTREVARTFTVPIEWFRRNPPEHYRVGVEVHPQHIAPDGSQTTLFPAKKLGLPERYYHSWRVRDQEVIVYATPEGVIWGMTAEVIAELLCRIDGSRSIATGG